MSTPIHNSKVSTDEKGLPVLVCVPNAPASLMTPEELLILERMSQDVAQKDNQHD
jgi:hypothetical protein